MELRRLRADACDEPKIVVYAVSNGEEVQALFREPAAAASMRDLMGRKSYRVDKWLIPAWVFEFEG